MYTKAKPMTAERAERILSKDVPTANQLKNVLYRAAEPYPGRAWKRLLQLYPDPDGMRGILYSAPSRYKRLVARLMLARGIAHNVILFHAPRDMRAAAAKHLLAGVPGARELRLIVVRAPEPYRSRAWKALVAMNDAEEIAFAAARAPKRFREQTAAV